MHIPHEMQKIVCQKTGQLLAYVFLLGRLPVPVSILLFHYSVSVDEQEVKQT